MSIVVQLNTDLEQRLREKANKRGIEVNQYVSQFLEHIFPNKVTTQPSVDGQYVFCVPLLQEWIMRNVD